MKSILVGALAGGFNNFERWMEQYGKKYADEAEHAVRQATYDANMMFIEEYNQNNHSAVLGENEFTDLSWAEFRSAYLMQGSWEGPEATLGEHEILGGAPDSVDWAKQGKVTAVKNQGQCGSCWSFSTTGSLESRYAIAKGKLPLLSEQQFVDCDKTADQGCRGGLPSNAYVYAESNPICTESEYPYTAADGTCKDTSKCNGLAKGALTGFKAVPNSVEALTDAVAQGPVSVGIEADKPIFQHFKSGVLTGSCGGSLDHAVLITGYGTDGGQAYWRVKNSWGPTWGDEGYVNIQKGKTGWMASTGECGIRGHAAYPVFGESEVVV
jgi:cathepsin L